MTAIGRKGKGTAETFIAGKPPQVLDPISLSVVYTQQMHVSSCQRIRECSQALGNAHT